MSYKSPTYNSWDNMIGRCYRKSQPDYDSYGGRGITVCDRWRNSYKDFLSDMGERPEGTTIDRIDTDGNYEPNNCRWSTNEEQQNNKRNSVKYLYNEKELTIKEISLQTGIPERTLWSRRNLGAESTSELIRKIEYKSSFNLREKERENARLKKLQNKEKVCNLKINSPQLSVDEIANIVGVSNGTVRNYLIEASLYAK